MRKTLPPAPPTKGLRFLYCNALGAPILKLMTCRPISRIAGKFLDSRLSKGLIKRYIRKNNVDMSLYKDEPYSCFNAFFTRRIREELRPIDREEKAFISPCDGKLTVFPVDKDSRFTVKGFTYSTETLLRDKQLAEKYEGGYCFIFRLCVDDFHRYSYLDDGEKGNNVFIKGKLHTVQPTALEKRRVFTENCREYTVLKTANFGEVTQVEVGAMMVGRIVNYHGTYSFKRGEEKGRFEFGGSTIIVLVQKDKVLVEEELLQNTLEDKETIVKLGERLGVAINEIANEKTEIKTDEKTEN